MAAKPGKRSVNKSEFVRGLPATLSAREVVAKAKEAGISLGEKHVHAIRSLARKSGSAPAPAGAPRRGPGRPRSRAPGVATAAPAAAHGAGDVADVEHALVELVLDHGIRRIEEALASVRERLTRSLV